MITGSHISILNLVNVSRIMLIFLGKGNYNIGCSQKDSELSGSSTEFAFLIEHIFLVPLFEINVYCKLGVAFLEV